MKIEHADLAINLAEVVDGKFENDLKEEFTKGSK